MYDISMEHAYNDYDDDNMCNVISCISISYSCVCEYESVDVDVVAVVP